MNSQATESPHPEKFQRVLACWICNSSRLKPIYPAPFRLAAFATEDPELAAYTGNQVWMNRCANCGFTLPEALPSLPNYFDRIYNQHWSQEWIQREFDSSYKDFIFQTILRNLAVRRSATSRPTLLDIGAHVGRFIYLAREAGWNPEGIELNPRTSAFAVQQTGLPIHQINAKKLKASGRRYNAITLIDVLEHIPEPIEILHQAADLLEPDGWLAIKVPCGPTQRFKEYLRSWVRRGYHPTDTLSGNLVHLSLFSQKSLRLALQKCGFRHIFITVAAPELADLRFQPGWKSQLSNQFRLAVYHVAKGLPGGVYTPLCLNLQAYAQKG